MLSPRIGFGNANALQLLGHLAPLQLLHPLEHNAASIMRPQRMFAWYKHLPVD